MQSLKATSPWGWLTRHRFIRRLVLITTGLWLTLITTAVGFAIADDFSGKSAADPVISWMDLTDTHGVPIYGYQVAGPSGGLDPIPSLWVSLAQLCFSTYREVAAYGIWFIDWVTGFSWFKLLDGPATSIASKLELALGQVHLAGLFMAITGLAALILYTQGKTSTAIYELCATWIIAALAAGMLANPLGTTGGDSGWIQQTRAGALEMAGAMVSPTTGDYTLSTKDGAVVDKPKLNTSTDTDALQKQLTSNLVDVFIRQPAQLISYGRVLDGGACEQPFTDISKAGPYSDSATPMDKIKDCDQDAGNFADNPSASQSLSALVLIPAALVVLFLGLLIGGAIIGSVGMILYTSVKLLWSLIVGLLPGGSRGGLMMDVGEILAGLILLFFSVFILAVYESIISDVFKSASGEALPKVFVEADILLVVLLVLYKKQKAKIQASAHRIAQLLAKRPGGGSVPIAARAPMSPARAVAAMETTRWVARKIHRRAAHNPAGNNPFYATQINVFGMRGASEEERDDPNVTVTQMPNQASDTEHKPSAATRLALITGRTVGRTVLSHATGGASTAILAANRLHKLHAARQRLALATSTRPGALPAAPIRPALGPGPSGRDDEDAAAGATASTPRAPRPRPGGGGLGGWLRSRRGQQPTPSNAGYTRVNTGGAAVLVPNSPQPSRPAGGFLRNFRRR